jgi:anthranilate phosphoribosyltransferase
MIHAALEKIVSGENLTRAEAEAVMEEYFSGQVSHAQISAFMTLMYTKGISRDEGAAIHEAETRHGRRVSGPAPAVYSEVLGMAEIIIRQGHDLSRIEAIHVMEDILSGRTEDSQIARLLALLRFKGETVDELVGFATAMRRHATPIFAGHSHIADEALVDTCGTGGDASGTFNVSTAAAFVVAGAGVRVAKHGNRSISSRCGSADVLEQLGVRIDLPSERIAAAIEEIGIGFLFAPAVHAATRHAMQARRDLKMRTVFNLLGPLTNPAGASAQIVGVYDESYTELLARALGQLGVKRAFVVHGADGLDEISISGETYTAELRDGVVRSFTLTPEDFGLHRALLEEIRGGDGKENAEIIHKIFGRSMLYREHGPHREIVLANAGAALVAAGRATDFLEGVHLAAKSIDSGAAREKLDALVAFSKAEKGHSHTAS